MFECVSVPLAFSIHLLNLVKYIPNRLAALSDRSRWLICISFACLMLKLHFVADLSITATHLFRSLHSLLSNHAAIWRFDTNNDTVGKHQTVLIGWAADVRFIPFWWLLTNDSSRFDSNFASSAFRQGCEIFNNKKSCSFFLRLTANYYDFATPVDSLNREH